MGALVVGETVGPDDGFRVGFRVGGPIGLKHKNEM